jgi:hypothetical protein
MTDLERMKDEAVKELAHVARELLNRLQEVDHETPGIFIQALHSKINYYESQAQ